MRSSRKLKSLYRVYNYKYFNNQLSDSAVVRWATVEEMRKKSVMFGLDGRYYSEEEMPNGRALILIDPSLRKRKRQMHMTILHEMNHPFTESERGIHGVGFEAGMLRLANMGAFKGLW